MEMHYDAVVFGLILDRTSTASIASTKTKMTHEPRAGRENG